MTSNRLSGEVAMLGQAVERRCTEVCQSAVTQCLGPAMVPDSENGQLCGTDWTGESSLQMTSWPSRS
jgi:hypothetical protein